MENQRLQAELHQGQVEIQTLRSQLNLWAHQVRRYRQISKGARSFTAEALVGVKHLQEGIFAMKRVEREAGKEWEKCQAALEKQMDENGTLSENRF